MLARKNLGFSFTDTDPTRRLIADPNPNVARAKMGDIALPSHKLMTGIHTMQFLLTKFDNRGWKPLPRSSNEERAASSRECE
jgi:hypothetical protein